MSRSRTLSWSSALRDLRADRAARKDIRKERLIQPKLSAWRGESGKRYVVSRGELSVEGVAAMAGASGSIVLIAAHRIDTTPAEIVDLYAGTVGSPDIAEWIEQARAWGANELHVHRFAETSDERTAVASDLTSELIAARHAAIAECRAGFAALMAEVA